MAKLAKQGGQLTDKETADAAEDFLVLQVPDYLVLLFFSQDFIVGPLVLFRDSEKCMPFFVFFSHYTIKYLGYFIS